MRKTITSLLSVVLMSTGLSHAQSAGLEIISSYSLVTSTDPFEVDFEGPLAMTAGIQYSGFSDGRNDKWAPYISVSYYVRDFKPVEIQRPYGFVRGDQLGGVTWNEDTSATLVYRQNAIQARAGLQFTQRLSRNINSGEWAFTLQFGVLYRYIYQSAYVTRNSDAEGSSMSLSEMEFGSTFTPGVRYSRPFDSNRYKRWSIGVDLPIQFSGGITSSSGSPNLLSFGLSRLRMGYWF